MSWDGKIYGKYRIEHTDGTPLKGKKYFVLRLDSDDPVEAAKVNAAMRAYNGEVQTSNINSAVMREAIDEVMELIDEWRSDDSMPHWQYSRLFDICDAALAEPPRNCDRFATWEETISSFREETGNIKPLELWLRCEIQAFADWLFASSTKQKGDDDGSK